MDLTQKLTLGIVIIGGEERLGRFSEEWLT